MQAQLRRRSARRRSLLSGALSVVAHSLVLLVLLLPARTDPPKVPDTEPVTVELVQAPSPVDAAPTPETSKPTPAPPSARRKTVKTAAAPRKAKVVPATEGLTAAVQPGDGDAEVGEAELASAATSESGPPGSACNMTRWLQRALRRDPRVQAAVAEAHQGRPIVLWNGDWIRRGGQDGNGLAAVREALMWEIGFAPVACRAEPVRGLVLITLNDAPGSARLVVGAGRWRWSDLLFAHSGAAVR